jgi:hypothetical protein
LTAEELAMDIDKELTTKNPQAAHNIMQYSFKDRKFIKIEVTDNLINHFSSEGDKLLVYVPMTEKEQKTNANPTETAEYAEQEEYKHAKKKFNDELLKKINEKIKDNAKKLNRKCCNCLNCFSRGRENFAEKPVQLPGTCRSNKQLPAQREGQEDEPTRGVGVRARNDPVDDF